MATVPSDSPFSLLPRRRVGRTRGSCLLYPSLCESGLFPCVLNAPLSCLTQCASPFPYAHASPLLCDTSTTERNPARETFLYSRVVAITKGKRTVSLYSAQFEPPLCPQRPVWARTLRTARKPHTRRGGACVYACAATAMQDPRIEIQDQQRDTEARRDVCIRMGGGRHQGRKSLVSRLGHAREGVKGRLPFLCV